jgi:hypothetical protein
VQTYSRAARENDFEKLLVQINDSIGVLSDKLEKVHRSIFYLLSWDRIWIQNIVSPFPSSPSL